MSITDIEFIRGMAQAVKERGEDYVYPDEWLEEYGGSCRYSIDGEPACIVGQAIYNVDPDAMPEPMDQGEAASLVLSVHNLSDSVLRAADEAQGVQDSLGPWGRAWEAFRDNLTPELRAEAMRAML
jgi:hypothetical protein